MNSNDSQESAIPTIIVDVDTLATTSTMNGTNDVIKSCRVNGKLKKYLANKRNMGYQILIVTGRHDKSRLKTLWWLNFYEIPHDNVLHRQDENQSPADFKFNTAKRLFESQTLIEAVLESDRDTIEKFRTFGKIHVLSVDKNVYNEEPKFADMME